MHRIYVPHLVNRSMLFLCLGAVFFVLFAISILRLVFGVCCRLRSLLFSSLLFLSELVLADGKLFSLALAQKDRAVPARAAAIVQGRRCHGQSIRKVVS